MVGFWSGAAPSSLSEESLAKEEALALRLRATAWLSELHAAGPCARAGWCARESEEKSSSDAEVESSLECQSNATAVRRRHKRRKMQRKASNIKLTL